MKKRPFNPICGLENFKPEELPTGLDNGIPVRERMTVNGGITKVNLEKDNYGYPSMEHNNQEQGSSF